VFALSLLEEVALGTEVEVPVKAEEVAVVVGIGVFVAATEAVKDEFFAPRNEGTGLEAPGEKNRSRDEEEAALREGCANNSVDVESLLVESILLEVTAYLGLCEESFFVFCFLADVVGVVCRGWPIEDWGRLMGVFFFLDDLGGVAISVVSLF